MSDARTDDGFRLSGEVPKKKKPAKRAATSKRQVAMLSTHSVIAVGVAPAELAAELSAANPCAPIRVEAAELGGKVYSVAKLGGKAAPSVPGASPPLGDFGRLVAVEYERGGQTFRHEYSVKSRRPKLGSLAALVIVPPLPTRGLELI